MIRERYEPGMLGLMAKKRTADVPASFRKRAGKAGRWEEKQSGQPEAEERQAIAGRRSGGLGEEMTTKQRLDQHDREIAAIRTLLKQGMKMLVEYQRENREEHSQIRKELRELAAQQKKTEASLQTFMDGLRRGANGHAKRKVDLQ